MEGMRLVQKMVRDACIVSASCIRKCSVIAVTMLQASLKNVTFIAGWTGSLMHDAHHMQERDVQLYLPNLTPAPLEQLRSKDLQGSDGEKRLLAVMALYG